MQKFMSPKSIDELCQALARKDEDTYVIAGGTDLIIHFNKNGIFDYSVIDITKLDELKEIIETDTEIIIGACVTMTEIENSEVINEYIPALIDSVRNLGSQQIRNRATLGGNIANASQSGDNLTVLFAYNAYIEIIDSKGVKRLNKINDVVEGLGKNNLSRDEIITKIVIEKYSSKSAFSKIGSRKAVTISKINCCIKINLNDEIVDEAIVYLGAVGPKPIKAKLIEGKIINRNINDINIRDINDAIYGQIECAIPDRSSKHYKKAAAEGLIEDVLKKLRSKTWNS